MRKDRGHDERIEVAFGGEEGKGGDGIVRVKSLCLVARLLWAWTPVAGRFSSSSIWSEL